MGDSLLLSDLRSSWRSWRSWGSWWSWGSWVRLMSRPCDPSSLATFRIAFGLLMVLDVPQERGLASLDLRFPEPHEGTCRFPLFDFLRPLSQDGMYALYLVMWAGAVGMTLGCVYRVSCVMFVVPYWFLFALDKSSWNNHSYLYGLIATQLTVCDAHRFWSVDAMMRRGLANTHVPLWNYWLLRFQIFVVYFIAGLKKMDSDWLMGYSMGNLSRHWLFSPFKVVLSEEWTSLLVIHGCGFLLDLSAGFLLLLDATRPLALMALTYFHAMNSQLFNIGMFPYAMIATSALFCSHDWPRKLLARLPECTAPWCRPFLLPPGWSPSCLYPAPRHSGRDLPPAPSSTSSSSAAKDCGGGSEGGGTSCSAAKDCGGGRKGDGPPTVAGWRHRVAAALILVFACEQLLLPYSHFITKGYNNWTNGLYGYSWDMMVHSRSHQHVKVTYRDRVTGNTGFLNPGVWTQTRRWKDHADMLKQYSVCLAERLREFNISDPEIYFDVWVSLNDRFQQRLYDPRVDILRADWSPFRPTPWLLPLLVELSPWRRRLAEIEGRLGNGTEVVFIADFPGLHLENFVGADLEAARITVLSGAVTVETVATATNVTLGEGESTEVPSGAFHRVYTVSEGPSCYLYEYENRTEAEMVRHTRRLLEAWQARESDVPAGPPLDSAWLSAEIATILNDAAAAATDGVQQHQQHGAGAEGAVGGAGGGAGGGEGGAEEGGGAPDWRVEALLRRFAAEESRSRRRGEPLRQRAARFLHKKFFVFRKSLLKTAFAVRNLLLGRPSAAQLQWEDDLAGAGGAQRPSRSEL
ncbi:vitamin K-dependent gamma-carboxylase isoform X1 [Petromyzon marinus]|uniref:vitamin K-dependent gamma-carboxylase isoform X1 n=1 Tax=Petromyzon marinus TaxID=7757 RepID=UPI003F727469